MPRFILYVTETKKTFSIDEHSLTGNQKNSNWKACAITTKVISRRKKLCLFKSDQNKSKSDFACSLLNLQYQTQYTGKTMNKCLMTCLTL